MEKVGETNISLSQQPVERSGMSPNSLNTKVSLAPMEWETSLLGRSLGRIEGIDKIGASIEVGEHLKRIEREAQEAGLEILISRVGADCFTANWALQANGFLLVDIGVTFKYELTKGLDFVHLRKDENLLVRDAQPDDLPRLQEMVARLFRHSFYYVSPFFTADEADLLFKSWVTNCIRKVRADRVSIAETRGGLVGFVACRWMGDGLGSIDLIGVHQDYSSRGVGKALVKSGLEILRGVGARTVTVRTQATNVASVNLYVSTGSRLFKVDSTFIKSLKR